MHETSVRVRYAETDKAGVVYHGRYLEWFEIGRTELLRSRGLAYSTFEKEYGLFLTVAEALLKFHKPAYYDDVILIETRIAEIRRVRFRLEHVLRRRETGETLCTGHIQLACITPDGRPVPLPEALLRRLEKEEHPEGKNA